jgi:hypothetical protein
VETKSYAKTVVGLPLEKVYEKKPSPTPKKSELQKKNDYYRNYS